MEAKQVRVSSKGQIVIPQSVRRRLGIRQGDNLIIVSGEHEALLLTARRYANALRGMAKGIYGRTREEVDAYVRGERETWRA